jgi:predicted ATPase
MSFDDTRKSLAAKFRAETRFANFGPVLERVNVSGFRGISDLELPIESPVVAISGLNGTGKSTVAQLLVCAYRGDPAIAPRHYVKDYFPVSVLDPQPFTDGARVMYEYATEIPGASQQVTVSRAAVEWSGYKRQPRRRCYYVGVTSFLPKVEKRDFTVYGSGAAATMDHLNPVADGTRVALASILGMAYDEAGFARVSRWGRSLDLAMVTRSTQTYSENHMGFGEGRMFYLVNLLESAPERSLFVIEEPETALHGDAQVRLAKYFVDVANRRRHQIVMTTHSSSILGQLSRSSVAYLRREPGGDVSATIGLSTYQVDSYLHEHGKAGAAICVEDDFAQILVTEVLRAKAPDLLSGVNFMPVGDRKAVASAVSLFTRMGLRSVGITDSDMTDVGANGVLSLPGYYAPELEVFQAQAVRDHFAAVPYSIDVAERLATVNDHHQFVRSVATALTVPEDSIATEACRAFVLGAAAGYFDDVVEFVRIALSDRR